MFVVDASVYASLVVRDEFYERARSFLLRSRDAGCVTLDLALVEAYNALWRHVYLLGRIPRERSGELASLLEVVFKGSVVAVYSASRECRGALELALSYGIPVYDAAYLSLARRLGFRLATFDLELEKRLEGTGLERLIYVP